MDSRADVIAAGLSWGFEGDRADFKDKVFSTAIELLGPHSDPPKSLNYKSICTVMKSDLESKLGGDWAVVMGEYVNGKGLSFSSYIPGTCAITFAHLPSKTAVTATQLFVPFVPQSSL